MSSGRSRSAGSPVSRLALGGFVVARREGQIEILPVWHAAELCELQHDATLRLEDGVVDRVEVLGINPLDSIRQLGVVARGVGDDQVPDVLRKAALARQPELLELVEQG